MAVRPKPSSERRRREIHALERLALHVPPHRQRRGGARRERQIHPAVLVEVERDDAAGGRRRGRAERVQLLERAFARVEQDRRLLAGQHEVDGAIVVQVARHDAGRVRDVEAALDGHVRERAVAVVAEQARVGPGDDQIEIAVVIDVHERDAHGAVDGGWKADFLRHVDEVSVAVVRGTDARPAWRPSRDRHARRCRSPRARRPGRRWAAPYRRRT